MVVHLGGPPPSAQANSPLAPDETSRISVADELNIRAVAALDDARERDGRAEAMNKAMILRNAVEVHEHFCAKGGAPSK